MNEKILYLLSGVVMIIFCLMMVNPAHAAEKLVGYATGYFISEDGYAVTNCHVACNSTKMILRVDGKEYVAHLVNYDNVNDVAIIKADLKGHKVKALPVSGNLPKIGTAILTLGFPMSSYEDYFQHKWEIQAAYGHLNQTLVNDMVMMDILINPGNSGSPVVANGAVIGTAEGGLALGEQLAYGQSIMVKSSAIIRLAKQVKGLVLKDISVLESLAFNSLSSTEQAAKVAGSTFHITIYEDVMDPLDALRAILGEVK